jgi:hypothetical protein
MIIIDFSNSSMKNSVLTISGGLNQSIFSKASKTSVLGVQTEDRTPASKRTRARR